MKYDHLQQGDYYASLYRLHQLTHRQLREERRSKRYGPSLARRLLTTLGNSLRQPAYQPRQWRARQRQS